MLTKKEIKESYDNRLRYIRDDMAQLDDAISSNQLHTAEELLLSITRDVVMVRTLKEVLDL
jgi:hypothetical protein